MQWEEVRDDGLPWESRGWFLTNSGRLGLCESIWDKGDNGPVYRGPRQPRGWPCDPLSYEDVEKILDRMKSDDASFKTAVIEFMGEDEFGARWLREMEVAPDVRYEGVPEANRVENRKPARKAYKKKVAEATEV